LPGFSFLAGLVVGRALRGILENVFELFSFFASIRISVD
jgi:hypothetical protein